MTAVIHYVMEDFNEYLDPVTFDYERIKTEQAAEKIRADIVGKYPQSVDAIIDFYKKTSTTVVIVHDVSFYGKPLQLPDATCAIESKRG